MLEGLMPEEPDDMQKLLKEDFPDYSAFPPEIKMGMIAEKLEKDYPTVKVPEEKDLEGLSPEMQLLTLEKIYTWARSFDI
jgi:hypothetical protein